MKTACLIYGPELHYLDHLAPLASLLDIPIITPEEIIQESIAKYYPETKVIYWDYLKIHSEFIRSFDAVIYSFTHRHFQGYFAFAQDEHKKYLQTIWCPHGNSDKDNLDSLKEEPFLLLYGQRMQELLQKKRIVKPSLLIGNYRYQYFLKHKKMYDSLLKEESKNLLKNTRTYLYAPTWNDYENSSSFEEAFPYLVDGLPNDCNLIVKLHPNSWMKNSFAIDRMLYPYENKKNRLFLRSFTPIYPLLDFVDAYIGDMSSIGYDFLLFDKPMFFLPSSGKKTKKPLLHTCGVRMNREDFQNIYSKMDELMVNDKAFSPLRKKLYEYTFGNTTLTKDALYRKGPWKTTI